MSIRVTVLVRTTAVFTEVTPIALFVHQPTDLNVLVAKKCYHPHHLAEQFVKCQRKTAPDCHSALLIQLKAH